mmetsp:Transcript_17546/g.37058  ORF Transcript_17546/g.37058 Transcript_17546/m.37058 type:complete len:295 (+) Transcript_17546:461-1345(+)
MRMSSFSSLRCTIYSLIQCSGSKSGIRLALHLCSVSPCGTGTVCSVLQRYVLIRLGRNRPDLHPLHARPGGQLPRQPAGQRLQHLQHLQPRHRRHHQHIRLPGQVRLRHAGPRPRPRQRRPLPVRLHPRQHPLLHRRRLRRLCPQPHGGPGQPLHGPRPRPRLVPVRQPVHLQPLVGRVGPPGPPRLPAEHVLGRLHQVHPRHERHPLRHRGRPRQLPVPAAGGGVRQRGRGAVAGPVRRHVPGVVHQGRRGQVVEPVRRAGPPRVPRGRVVQVRPHPQRLPRHRHRLTQRRPG